ncbi:hypothetical protein OH492_03795 [Vibrio chagasii]|nr:hypothetical protein [Vibrio chagasii]
MVSSLQTSTKVLDKADPKEQGAGDQGIMFGYATNETGNPNASPITYSHLLLKSKLEVRKSGQPGTSFAQMRNLKLLSSTTKVRSLVSMPLFFLLNTVIR